LRYIEAGCALPKNQRKHENNANVLETKYIHTFIDTNNVCRLLSRTRGWSFVKQKPYNAVNAKTNYAGDVDQVFKFFARTSNVI
jgi:hypothetical protein